MKLLFTDLDGTLLDDAKNISDADMAAIHAMIDAASAHKREADCGKVWLLETGIFSGEL